jgi:hypothetical protein
MRVQIPLSLPFIMSKVYILVLNTMNIVLGWLRGLRHYTAKSRRATPYPSVLVNPTGRICTYPNQFGDARRGVKLESGVKPEWIAPYWKPHTEM